MTKVIKYCHSYFDVVEYEEEIDVNINTKNENSIEDIEQMPAIELDYDENDLLEINYSIENYNNWTENPMHKEKNNDQGYTYFSN